MPRRTDPDYSVPNLERALSIMEYLAEHPDAGLSHLAEVLKMPKNSVFRITQTLLHRGWLMRDETTKAFILSGKLLALGFAGTNKRTIVECALDDMRALRDATGETVLLGAPPHPGGHLLGPGVGVHPFKFMVEPGTRFKLYTSAPGKALLAFLPEAECRALIRQQSFERYTPNTLTSAEELEKEIALAREQGVAFDRAEEMDGCHCISAPVFDRKGHPIAAIWMTGPANRVPRSAFPSIAKLVKEHAARISQRLGNGQPPAGQ